MEECKYSRVLLTRRRENNHDELQASKTQRGTMCRIAEVSIGLLLERMY